MLHAAFTTALPVLKCPTTRNDDLAVWPSISRSRSTMIRTPTLCTRPALNEGRIFAPKHGTQFETNQAVKDAPSLLGVDQVCVHRSWRLDGLQNGGLRDFRKHDSLGLGRLQIERFHQVPADRLSFAVLIRREPHGLGFLRQSLELCHHLFRRGTHLVFGGEVVVNVNAVVAFGKVSMCPIEDFTTKSFPR